ncbi:binding-protein-dependent transport systems inner membrane component [Paenibacillus alvei TS-15]|uniref:Binding-protein-dependent transport systems inner membrane component n=1 Tax=Paenibacillus alvei TS-15 TaxID=1117108 RepID=S9SKB5_PAEAL|nr:ABC transporter permease [Paenibacillus alvei]EPY05104.1 binding-protein-dependent transport systems inner membrane component [Paenibacillus alvei TS-15]
MNLVLHMVKSLCLSFFALIMIMLIVLFPRKLDIGMEGYKMTAKYHFSWSQYAENITGFIRGIFVDNTLGVTRYGEAAGSEVLTVMGNSLTIIVIGFLLSFTLGLLKGIADYKLSKSKWNVIGNGTTWLFQSVPDFMVVLLIQWFVIRYMPFIHFFEQKEWYAFLIPSVLVSVYPAMYIARITSAAIAAQEGQMYIQVAKAKGVAQRMILYKHVGRNSMGTILSHLPSLFGYILSNLLMVEYLMSYPGAAYRLFQAIDYDTSFGSGVNYEPGVIIGIACCFTIMVVLVQWIALLVKRSIAPTSR